MCCEEKRECETSIETRLLELERKFDEYIVSTRQNGTAENQKSDGWTESRLDLFYENIAPFMEKIKYGGDEIVANLKHRIVENPGLSIAAAFGAGIIAAKLLEGRNARRKGDDR